MITKSLISHYEVQLLLFYSTFTYLFNSYLYLRQFTTKYLNVDELKACKASKCVIIFRLFICHAIQCFCCHKIFEIIFNRNNVAPRCP